jgi:hypothetical protein
MMTMLYPVRETEMKGVSIFDTMGGILTVSLEGVLDALGELVDGLRWRISNAWCMGENAEEFERLSSARAAVDTTQLQALARSVHQIIDGDFSGSGDGDLAPRIVIRAVDSSCFDVESDDERILERMRRRYVKVTDMP